MSDELKPLAYTLLAIAPPRCPCRCCALALGYQRAYFGRIAGGVPVAMGAQWLGLN